MASLASIFANEQNAARMLDLRPAEFRSLVDQGHLPKPRDIGGFPRWDIEELRRIIRGEAVEGMGAVQW
ncbi:MAG: hypothetical protein K0B00_08315 [Rhodobacteraceae bacterium]|nr:hypothetical protein [Paracoccaceae bacterium]